MQNSNEKKAGAPAEKKGGRPAWRKLFMEKGFELFSTRSIEAVTLQDVADASGHGVATLYRYFNSKIGLLLEISAWKWGEFFENNRRRHPEGGFADKSARDMFDFYLDSYLEVYRNYRDLLRFNQMFNIYLKSEEVERGHVDVYRGLMKPITDFFHLLYEKGKLDGTVRTDVEETEMLSTTIHLMLAAVTRYAIGLVYEPAEGFDDLKELESLKEMLFLRYTNS